MLRIDGLRAGYGKTPILHGVSIDVPRGETIAVLGRNGAGKTTLLRAAMGLIETYDGVIRLDGQELSGHSTHERARRGMAYVPQGRDIFPGLSVLDNLRVAAYGTRQRNVDQQLEIAISELPALRPRLAARGSSLSGGQQQMLAIGRALMADPRVLLLDEPSEGLAPKIVEEIEEIVRRASQSRGLTVVLVEQNLDVAERLASQAVILEKGEIVRRMPARELLADEELQREYMGI